MLPVAVARSFSGRVTKSQPEGGNLGVFFPIDNPLYSIAYGTHTKTADPIEMLFWMMTQAGPMYHVLDGDQISKGNGQFFGSKGQGHEAQKTVPAWVYALL